MCVCVCVCVCVYVYVCVHRGAQREIHENMHTCIHARLNAHASPDKSRGTAAHAHARARTHTHTPHHTPHTTHHTPHTTHHTPHTTHHTPHLRVDWLNAKKAHWKHLFVDAVYLMLAVDAEVEAGKYDIHGRIRPKVLPRGTHTQFVVHFLPST